MHSERVSDSSSDGDWKVLIHNTVSKLCHDGRWSCCASLQKPQRCQSLCAASCKQSTSQKTIEARILGATKHAVGDTCMSRNTLCVQTSTIAAVFHSPHDTSTTSTGAAATECTPARPIAILCRQAFSSRVVGTVLHIGMSSVIRLRTRDMPLPVVPETQDIETQSRHDAKLVSICSNQSRLLVNPESQMMAISFCLEGI